jgi:hypothetical protein
VSLALAPLIEEEVHALAPVEGEIQALAPVVEEEAEVQPGEAQPEVAPVEAAPVEVQQAEAAPVEVQQVEAAPVEVQQAEAAPVEVQPVEVQPAQPEAQPVEVQPEAQPAQPEVQPAQQVEISPVEVQPAQPAEAPVKVQPAQPVEISPVSAITELKKVTPHEVHLDTFLDSLAKLDVAKEAADLLVKEVESLNLEEFKDAKDIFTLVKNHAPIIEIGEHIVDACVNYLSKKWVIPYVDMHVDDVLALVHKLMDKISPHLYDGIVAFFKQEGGDFLHHSKIVDCFHFIGKEFTEFAHECACIITHVLKIVGL